MNGNCCVSRDRLVADNLPLAYFFAKKYLWSGIEYADLVSTANIGLIKAARVYDPANGFKFSTLVSKCVRDEIVNVIRREKRNPKAVSLDRPIRTTRESGDIKLIDTLSTNDPSVDVSLERDCSVELVRALLGRLSERERNVVTSSYGVGREAISQCEIGRRMGLSQSSVSRILRESLDNMRALLEAQEAAKEAI